MNRKYRMRGYPGPVTILKTDAHGVRPVIALDEFGTAHNYHLNGTVSSSGDFSEMDLVSTETEIHEENIDISIGKAIIELHVKFEVGNGYDIDLISIYCGLVDLANLLKIESVRNDIKNAILNLDNWDKK